jgi:hypothetical protein
MAKKKSAKSKSRAKRFVAKKQVSPEEGFFARLRDVLPPPQKKETVRVKTFIVEKPVYVSSREKLVPPPQKYGFMGEPEPVEKLDSRKSRYSKRRQIQEDLQEEQNDLEGEEQTGDELDDGASGEDLGADEEMGEGEEMTEEGMDEETPPDAPQASRVRSGAMFNGVWWKKALFWAILLWLLILGIESVMHALKLVDLNLTRQWWVLLALIIVLMLVYEKFFSNKIKL